jgi:hypothetical protein
MKNTAKTVAGRLALVYLTCFALLITGGILIKRAYDRPQYMMLFHLPAAVFLVLAGMEMKKRRQREYEQEIAAAQALAEESPEDQRPRK